MQVGAHILIETEPGKYSAVVEAASKISGVRRVDVVTGICDAIAYVEAADLGALKGMLDKLHAVKGIRSTRTGIKI